MQILKGFSKLGKAEKLDILKKHVPLDEAQIELLLSFQSNRKDLEDVIENFSENHISNFWLPLGVAPNFIINNRAYFAPMVTEESSVVAAAANAAKFWADKGGFKAKILGTKKAGQIYFTWQGDIKRLENNFSKLKELLRAATSYLTSNMEKRGGGILDITLNENNPNSTDYHIINVYFETADSMGANLINSCLEAMIPKLKSFITSSYPEVYSEPEIIMGILSNYTPECLVECWVECDIEQLSEVSGNITAQQFAKKFEMAVKIASENVQRAVTHNKGIFNGIDAVLLATGNDFRAVEACGHAFASRNGYYTSLTKVEVSESKFKFSLQIPLAIGTVGGITSVHPLAKLSLQIMQNPLAEELMQIIAAVGLASNFAAIRSLITDGIQKGHMKLHLNNIIYHFNANETERLKAEEYFKNQQVSFKAVSDYLNQLRSMK